MKKTRHIEYETKQEEPETEETAKKSSGGNIYYYVTCPVCHRNMELSKFRQIIENPPKYEKFYIIQARQQHPRMPGGKSLGFTLVPELSLTIDEALSNHEYADVIQKMLEKLNIALKTFKIKKV
ncbi:MAG: hypothetical protein QXK87_06945 [Fervidicoccaceae archaeon]